MPQRKPLICLWLILWAEATRPGDPPPVIGQIHEAKGNAAPLRVGVDFPPLNPGQESLPYQHASVKNDKNPGSFVDKRDMSIGRELVARASDLDTSYLEHLANAWNVSFNTPLLDRAEALGLARAAHGDKNRPPSLLESREVTNENGNLPRVCETFGTCCNEKIICPEHIRGVEKSEGLDGVEWEIHRHQKTSGKLMTAFTFIGAALLSILVFPGGALAGLAIAGGYTVVKALFSGDAPLCPRVEFKKVRQDAGWWARKTGFHTEQTVRLEDLTLAMTIQFVNEAMQVDEEEAHDFRTDVQRNGKGVFACNVLMYHSDLWDGKLTNSELYTRDGPAASEEGMDAKMKAENNFMEALDDENKPKARALQWCRYLMCKHAEVQSRPLRNK